MAKYNPTPISTTLSNSAATTINDNLTRISEAIENTVSRDGDTPNQFTADIDLNHNDILNAKNVHVDGLFIDGVPVKPGDPVTTNLLPVDNRDVIWSGQSTQFLDIGSYDNDHKVNIVHTQSIASDFATLNVNRSSGVTGGVDAALNSALRIENSVLNSDPFNASTNPYGRGSGYDGKPYEWGLGVVTNNSRNFLSGGYKGQNGAAYFAGYRKKADAGGTWGINAFVIDYPGQANPTQVTVAAEFDVHGDGTDANAVRIGVSSFIKSTTSSDLNPSGFGEGSYAFFAGTDGNIQSGSWFSKWKTGFYAMGPMNIAFDCADTTNPFATSPYSTPVALRMSAGMKVAFDAESKHSLRFLNSGNKLVWNSDSGSGSADVFALDAFGNAVFGNATPNVVADFVWVKAQSPSNAAIQVIGNTVDARFQTIAGNRVEVGSYSNHPFLVFQNAVERFRVITPNTGLAVQYAATGTSYANDAAAAAGGVAVGQLYRNGSVVQIRVS